MEVAVDSSVPQGFDMDEGAAAQHRVPGASATVQVRGVGRLRHCHVRPGLAQKDRDGAYPPQRPQDLAAVFARVSDGRGRKGRDVPAVRAVPPLIWVLVPLSPANHCRNPVLHHVLPWAGVGGVPKDAG